MYFPFDSWWEREKKKQWLHCLGSEWLQPTEQEQARGRSGVPTWLDLSHQWDARGGILALLDAAMLFVRDVIGVQKNYMWDVQFDKFWL